MAIADPGCVYTVDELVTLHDVEPKLHEVLVEGRTDAAVVSWFLSKASVDAEVFPVSDRVAVTSELVREYGYDYGERGKVLTVAHLIDQHPTAHSAITCIADADYAYSLEPMTVSAKCLLLTDYSDLGLYCFDRDVVDKFLRLALRASDDIASPTVCAAIETAVSTLYLVRWLLRRIPGQPPLVSKVERRLRLQDGIVVLDGVTLIRDSINACKSPDTRRGVQLEGLITKLKQCEASLSTVEPRKRMNGHDFVRVFCFFISRAHPQLLREDRRGFRDPYVTAATLLTCIDFGVLAGEKMFQELLRRVQVRQSGSVKMAPPSQRGSPDLRGVPVTE